MELDVRSALVLRHPTEPLVLLLRRSASKKLFPNLITGIGGKVELTQGEGNDLIGAAWREFDEETQIPHALVTDVRLRLATIVSRGEQVVLLLWLTGQLTALPPDLGCTEGQLAFHAIDQLPINDMIPTARHAIPFILALAKDDPVVYSGCFDHHGRLMTNR
ncbi:MAG: NUDIX domain-containing protein [Caldilineaceae bacterium]|nr:NUDIX domain-containing protein [Caldilineaceae bacterium]